MRKMVLLSALAAAFMAATVSAQSPSKKTRLTFSGPVQIPGPHTPSGVVTLDRGTYVFKLLDSPSNRKIVEVTNERENTVYATVMTINDYRLNAGSKTVTYFSESAAGSPPAVKSWFYPGDNYGQRFVYPKVKAVELATEVKQPVPSYTPPPQPDVRVVERTKIVEVPVYIYTPAKQEVTYDVAQLAPQDATDTAGVDGEAVTEPAPLPTTASSLQVFGLMGLLLLIGSFAFRRMASVLG
jgi:hypothetical protein